MFSVVIPAYNCEKTIYETLESVFGQTRRDLIDEIIIINDGSSDNSDTIIRCYLKEHSEIKSIYIIQENKGVSRTRNTAIRMASAEWIALLDADDIWLPNKLERQWECIHNNPEICFLGCIYPFKILFRKYKAGLYKITPEQLCIRNMPSTPSVVFKKNVGLELGLYNEAMKYGEDINFFQKFFLRDSYFILAEELIRISVGKRYFAESGLSSDLLSMHKGRNKNTEELYEMGLISKSFFHLMLIMNELKFVRRQGIKKLTNIRYKDMGDKKNMFSVVVPAYNCERTIVRALNSVKDQSRYDLVKEIIIVNDGSTDGTDCVISDYIKDNAEMNFKYIKQENHGVSYARNVGIKRASGEWIALLDSDDIWMKNKLEKQIGILGGGGYK